MKEFSHHETQQNVVYEYANPTWPSYSLLPHILTFSTYHNLGCILSGITSQTVPTASNALIRLHNWPLPIYGCILDVFCHYVGGLPFHEQTGPASNIK